MIVITILVIYNNNNNSSSSSSKYVFSTSRPLAPASKVDARFCDSGLHKYIYIYIYIYICIERERDTYSFTVQYSIYIINECLFHRPVALDLRMSMTLDTRGGRSIPTRTTCRVSVYFTETSIIIQTTVYEHYTHIIINVRTHAVYARATRCIQTSENPTVRAKESTRA